jgi:hypothetical protein
MDRYNRRRIRTREVKASATTWVMSQKHIFTERPLRIFLINIPFRHLCIKHHSTYKILTEFMNRIIPHKAETGGQQHVKVQISAVITLFNPIPKTNPPPAPWKPHPTITTLPSFYPAHRTVKKSNQRRPYSTETETFFSKKKKSKVR